MTASPTLVRTPVGIVGGGPAGLLLSHLLHRSGVDHVVLEARSREEIEHTHRAGILEAGAVRTLVENGLDRVLRDGDSDRPGVLWTDPQGAEHEIRCDVLVGADGLHSTLRHTLPEAQRRTFVHEYPYAWFAKRDPVLDEYGHRVSERVWRAQHHSAWMSSMLHSHPGETGFAARRRVTELRTLNRLGGRQALLRRGVHGLGSRARGDGAMNAGGRGRQRRRRQGCHKGDDDE